RDVFLDNVPTRASIDREFQRLKQLARTRGSAVAIGHPYPETLSYLESVLPGLAAEGIDLVTIEALLREKKNGINGEFLQN
ncbi:MAG: divergent polysaccharide deacetylase family protein, partial [Gammaproteobacteria bacterium]|nr:divergent polysaccharide deacetylase family protein [Gammaproteobacteria bacterium]